jgi:hypothetical protein
MFMIWLFGVYLFGFVLWLIGVLQVSGWWFVAAPFLLVPAIIIFGIAAAMGFVVTGFSFAAIGIFIEKIGDMWYDFKHSNTLKKTPREIFEERKKKYGKI